MSWFGSFEDLERASRAEIGAEPAPGVQIVRRTFVLGTFAAAATLLAGCRSAAPQLAVLDDGERALEDLVHALRPRARALIAESAPDEEVYLAHVARSLARLEPPRIGVDELEPGRWDMDARCRFPPIAVFEMRLAPGARIELHDHRDYNGVLGCAAGSVRCASYDILGDVAEARGLQDEDSFLVSRLSQDVLLPGSVSTLSRSARNLHELEAGPDGGVLYDVFTYFDPKARSHSVLLGEELDVGSARYEARWKRG